MPLVLRRQLFDSDDWLFELKWDGFRALAYVEPRAVTLVSRTGHVYRQYDALRASLRRELRVRSAVIDGEVVCLDEKGRPCFLDLMRRREQPVFVAFDVLRHGKQDLGAWPLWRRKKRLRQIIPIAASSVLWADYVEREGVALYQEAVRRDHSSRPFPPLSPRQNFLAGT